MDRMPSNLWWLAIPHDGMSFSDKTGTIRTFDVHANYAWKPASIDHNSDSQVLSPIMKLSGQFRVCLLFYSACVRDHVPVHVKWSRFIRSVFSKTPGFSFFSNSNYKGVSFLRSAKKRREKRNIRALMRNDSISIQQMMLRYFKAFASSTFL